MSWKLDNIDFQNYGVYVSKSSGVLDLPSMVDTSIDWLDQDGRDYWQTEEVKYEDSEILLSCWIVANGYTEFKTKVAAFYSALTGPGKRQLETPFNNTVEVYLQDQVQLIRKTSYISTKQAGVFTLRLTVPGDSKTKLITIYRGDGQVQAVAKYSSDAQLDSKLHEVSTINFTAEFNTKPTLGRGDYILVDNQQYFHFEYPEVNKISSNKYVYNLNFEHKFKYMQDVRFKILGKAHTSWWGTMKEALDLIIQNTERCQPGMFIAGSVEATENRNHRFDSESCFDVLTRLVSEYEMEYEYILDFSNGVITINIAKRIGNASGVTLKYGKGNNSYKIRRIPTPREKLCTRLFAWGSNKNLPVGYPYERLALDNPIERDFFNMQIERDKIYDDIKPERTGHVRGYVSILPPATWTIMKGTENWPKPVRLYDFHADETSYEISDSSMPFDLFEKKENGDTVYLINGTTAKIHFNTGDLAGYEFEVIGYDHSTKTFKISPITEGGTKLPSATLKPRPASGDYPGDEYVIIDINLPQSYVDDAKARLYAAAWASMYDGIDYNPPQADYEVDILPGFNFTAKVGDTVILDEPDFANATLRIVSYSKNLYTGWKKVTLSPNVYKSTRAKLESKVAELERAVQATKLNDVNQQRGSQKTTQEIESKLIDPLDSKFRADENIRDRSIDARMLSLDAIGPQMSFRGALVDLDVDDDPNKLSIDAGQFLIHSFYAVDRKTIKTIKEA